jgi:phage-related tail fiber protein
VTITDSGRELLAQAIRGDKTAGFNAFNKMDIGEAGGNTDPSLNTLDASITNNTPFALNSVTRSLTNQVEFYARVSGASYSGYVIREVGIFDSAGSTMLLRIPIDPIGPLESTKNYDIRIVIEVE